jgi:hypothetical protein
MTHKTPEHRPDAAASLAFFEEAARKVPPHALLPSLPANSRFRDRLKHIVSSTRVIMDQLRRSSLTSVRISESNVHHKTCRQPPDSGGSAVGARVKSVFATGMRANIPVVQKRKHLEKLEELDEKLSPEIEVSALLDSSPSSHFVSRTSTL